MITARLRIADGEIEDTFRKWGFIYMESDNRTEAPIKKRETTSYSEEPGEHVDPRTVQDAFDYKVEFLIECPNRNLLNANAKIAAFNKALYTQPKGSNIRTYKTVTFYNDYKRAKIVGLPEPIAVPTEFYRRQDGTVLDCVQVEWNIRVTNPAECDFETQTQGTSFMRVGDNIKEVRYISYIDYGGQLVIFGTVEPYSEDSLESNVLFVITAYYPQSEQPYGTLGILINGEELSLAITASDFDIDIKNNTLNVNVPESTETGNAYPEIQIASNGLPFIELNNPLAPVGYVKAGEAKREFKYIYYTKDGVTELIYGLTESISGEEPDPATIAFMASNDGEYKQMLAVVNGITYQTYASSSDTWEINMDDNTISIHIAASNDNPTFQVIAENIPFIELKN